ncbi:cytochrome C-type biogenesis protein [Sorangium cellulosum]|uniref:Cytochrome C-type biogenesis protein n=1 Tax=Sorangium cellulosum TaxID=56 RepID=A0A2L0F3A5_SORCE|nr:TlpA disulfide reductase family protein [Sorangium cellulosum]AUX46042.1 cytochrome C-type biogenesis protein [Sorangium cellulosum]
MKALAIGCALLAIGCSGAGSGGEARAPAPGADPPAATAAVAGGPVLTFSYETLDGRELSTASLAGRLSVIGFVATYDVASQAEARFLAGLLRDHTPRINVALLVLEASENRPLIEAFVAALKLPYPVAIADAPTIAGEGPFAGLHHVPSVVILDPEGREVFRHVGLITQEALEETLRGIERAKGTAPAR